MGHEHESNELGAQGAAAAPGGDADTREIGSDVLEMLGELQGRINEIRRAHAEQAKTEAALSASRQAIDAQRAELVGQREVMQADRAEFDALRRSVGEQIEQARAATKEHEVEAARRLEAVRELGERLERWEEDLTARDAELATRCELARSQAEGAAMERREAELALVESRQALVRANEARDQSESAIRRERGSTGELERRSTKLAAEIESLRSRCTGLEVEAQQARDQGEESSRELEQRVGELAAQKVSLEAGSASLHGEVTRLEKELLAAKGMLDEAGAQEKADPRELAKRDLAIQVLKDRLEKAVAARQAVEVEVAGAKGESAHLRTQIGGLQSRVAALQEQLEIAASAKRSVDEASGPDKVALRNISRRRRLATYKSLLQAQARKIIAAKGAMVKRQAECDAVLAQRPRLAAAIEAVRVQERKLVAKGAKSGALALVFYVVGTIGVILALSWAITAQVAPATYVARATISAERGGITPSDTELQGWQVFHEDLAIDPRMMEAASERFRQRGLETLGTPAEVQSWYKAGMFASSSQDGQLTLELRGVGASRTQRELDTFVTAMVSVANAGRAARTDAMATAIIEPAKAGDEPVADQRLLYAGGMAGGGFFGASLLGLGVWGRLKRSKSRYEETQRLEEAMEGMQWANVEPSVNAPAVAERKGKQAKKGKRGK
ncbi:MAG: hypothetical protein H7Y88_09355 [Phycisphaerales bacterium]|nr:hypothetical protein [Phycisphaerales bacterium]